MKIGLVAVDGRTNLILMDNNILASDYLLHRIDVENYMRQRSLLTQKKNNIITKKERDNIRYEFVKTYNTI